MAIIDRSKEFHATVKGIQSRGGHLLYTSEHQESNVDELPKMFVDGVDRLTHNLMHMDSAMIQLYTTVNQEKIGVDSQDAVVSQWTLVVKTDITQINDQLRVIQTQLEGKDICNPSIREHFRQIVKILQLRFASMSSAFKETLQSRSDRILASKQRREQLGSTGAFIPQHDHSIRSRRVIDTQVFQSFGTNIPESGSMEMNSDSHSSKGAMYQRQQQHQATIQSSNQQYQQSRNVALESVEAAIQELGYVFSHLAHLVSIQGETVQRIDADIEEAQVHVEQGQQELLKYWRYVSSNRWLLIKCFAILIAFLFFFSILFA
jgi:syntaxin 5